MIDPTKPLGVSETGKQQENSTRPPTPASWKPGQSGNPNGRPKRDWTFKGLIEEALEEAAEIKNGGTIIWKKAFIKRLVQKAVSGDLKAMEMIMDRLDGKPQQKLDIDAKGDWNITLKRDEK